MTLHFKTGMSDSQRYPLTLYMSNNGKDFGVFFRPLKPKCASHSHREATIKNNKLLAEQTRISHSSLRRQGFKWYRCELDMLLHNGSQLKLHLCIDTFKKVVFII